MIFVFLNFFLVNFRLFNSIQFKLIVHHVLCNFLFTLSFRLFGFGHILDVSAFQIESQVFFLLVTLLKRSPLCLCLDYWHWGGLWDFGLLALLTSKGLLLGHGRRFAFSLSLLLLSVFSY